MTISKDNFVTCINGAIEESKNILKVNSLNDNNNSYSYKIALSKIDRVCELLNELVSSRITSMNDKEITNYKDVKLIELVNEINRCMLLLEKNSNDSSNLKEKIEDLLKQKNRLENETNDSIKTRLIDELKLSINSSEDNNEANIFKKIYKDDKSLNEFFELLENYRKVEKELSSAKVERKLIMDELMPKNTNYSYTAIEIDDFLTKSGLEKIESEIAKYVQKSTQEEMAEKENFGERARNIFIKTIDDNNCNPIDKESLDFIKNKLAYNSRLYDKAILELEEWEILNNKTFKTNEVNQRLSDLAKEIRETKNEINEVLVNWYKEYYLNNDMYKPISTIINNKFVYYVGCEYLNSLFLYKEWPTKEEINLLSSTRVMNKEEAEKQILKIELAKKKYVNLFTPSINEKELEKSRLYDKLVSLVGDLNNPLVKEIVKNHFLKGLKKEEKTNKSKKKNNNNDENLELNS